MSKKNLSSQNNFPEDDKYKLIETSIPWAWVDPFQGHHYSLKKEYVVCSHLYTCIITMETFKDYMILLVKGLCHNEVHYVHIIV